MKAKIFFVAIVAGFVLFPPLAYSQTVRRKAKIKAANIIPLLDANSPHALAGTLRAALIKNLPNPLYEENRNWGRKRMVPHALKWRRRGIFFKPEIHKTPRNDGTWRKIRLESISLPNTLILDIRKVRFDKTGNMYFDLYLAFDGRATYWHHVWESGVRLYAGSVRARFRAKVLLRCEVTSRLEAGKYFIPDAVFRMRAKQAHLAYDNLVFEHIPGIGGDAAKILGGAFHGAIRQWHPSLERGLLQKGNAAIVKAADTKDVRLSLGRVFSKVFPK